MVRVRRVEVRRLGARRFTGRMLTGWRRIRGRWLRDERQDFIL